MRSSHRRPGARSPWRAVARWTLAAGALAVLAAGCTTAAVKTTPAARFDASAYRTYEWGTPAPVVVADQERERDAAVLEWTIRNAIDQTLAAKGYQRIVAGEPDFLVDFGVRLEERSADTFGQYIKYRDEGGKQGLGSAFVFGYEQGSVAIEITDARSNTPLWTGSERIVLDDGQDVSKIEDAAKRILAGFPGKNGAATTTTPPARKAPENTLGDFRPPEP